MKKILSVTLTVLSVAMFATTTLNIGTADAATKWEKISVGSSGARLYKNNYTKQCLDSNSSGKVYTNRCSTSNKYQQWTLVSEGGPYYKQRNGATGRCLTTANEHSASNARTGSCTSNFDMYDWY